MKLLSINIIKDDGAAQQLGLQPHDLIYQINGQHMADPDELPRILSAGRAFLNIIRDGDQFTVEVDSPTLGVVLGQVEFDEEDFFRVQQIRRLPLATTPTLPGKNIINTCGMVASQCIEGTDMVADIAAHLRDIVGGRATALEKRLSRARDLVTRDIRHQAHGLGANAVVGLSYTYSDIGDKYGFIILVTATGTAVTTD